MYDEVKRRLTGITLYRETGNDVYKSHMQS